MIDIHTHLLPGIDDGTNSIDESIAILEMFYAQGCNYVVCTPHISSWFPNSESTIVTAFHEFQLAFQRKGWDIKLSYGAEYSSDILYESLLSHESIVFLNNENNHEKKYVLLELPIGLKPPWFDKLIEKLLSLEIGIVVAHPERHSNLKIFEDFFSSSNSILALNISSILGEDGAFIKANSLSLLNQYGQNVVICSDTHPALNRLPKFNIVVSQLKKKFLPIVVNYWVHDLPQIIIQGENNNLKNYIISGYLKY